MLAIGAGAGLSWGLMDALSMSVVPKERAGMATGIFSTTRVAGEGVALAIVSAVMASLVACNLPQGQASEGARLLAIGDLNGATAMLPQISQSALTMVYSEALQHLLWGLAALTTVAAIIAFVFLRHVQAEDIAEGTAKTSLTPSSHKKSRR